MPTGIVKAFHRSKGYGFIRPEAGGKDVFVHRTALETTGLKELRKGQKVEFDQTDDQGRPVAKNLRLEADKQLSHGVVASFDPPAEGEKCPAADKSIRLIRQPISRAALEQSLTDAVRKLDPECQDFVGLIVERIVPETPDGPNWDVKGVKFGKADRDRCRAALGVSLREKQQQYTLTDDHAEIGKQL